MLKSLDSALADGVKKRELWAWAMYDFANSAYTTVVITAIYNAYFVAEIAKRASYATLAWTLALSCSYALIMLTAPVLGRYADRAHAKKRLLMIMTCLCLAGTVGLALAGPGQIALALVLLVVSNYAFGSGENLCAAFLPELAKPEAMGKISGFGWSLGYLGGLFSLGLCLVFIGWAQPEGWAASAFVPVCLVITAVCFGLGALPTFLLLRERRSQAPNPHAGESSWQALRRSLDRLRALPELRALLISIIASQAGIQTVIALAAVFAQEALGFKAQQTVMMLFVVNITAAIGAFGFGLLQDRIGHRTSLVGSLLLWILAIAVLAQSYSQTGFWIAANLAGLALGAAQSAGRALVGVLSPYSARAEFYALWGLAVKLGSIIGPISYGLTEFLSGNNHRLAMWVTALFFVLGLLLLIPVHVVRGRERVAALT